jgi:hypothetical protein
VLQHSLGVDQYGDGNQYRNHFVTSSESKDGKLCEELVSLGMMRSQGARVLAGGMHFYNVTPNGIDAVALQSPARPPRPKLTRGQQRYRDYIESETSLTFAEWIGASK